MGAMADALPPCPECAHEWSPAEASDAADDVPRVIRDSVGNVLADGDTVVVVRDLKVKGSPTSIKVALPDPTSPTTSHARSSKSADSEPNYTLDSDEPYYYSPTHKSGAVSTGSSWAAGKEKSVIVLDSLDAPSDLKTKWERWATLVSTSLY